LIFTEYKKGSDLFTVRKWRQNGAKSLIDSKFNDENPEKRKKTYIDAIMSKKVAADRVHEDELCVVFKPKNTDAKHHFLVVPKDDLGLSSLMGAEEKHAALLGHLMVVAGKIGKEHMPEGYRVVMNNGEGACQNYKNLYVQVLGG
jgi:diadenosine tetraphosphate (Ap4A) HIT family hydrolase